MQSILEHVHTLFNGIPGSEAQQQASRWLLEFEHSPEALPVAIEILRHREAELTLEIENRSREALQQPVTSEGYFFACQLLISKIKCQWTTIEVSDWEYIAQFLVNFHNSLVKHFVQYDGEWVQSSDSLLYTRVCIAIVGIAFRSSNYGENMLLTTFHNAQQSLFGQLQNSKHKVAGQSQQCGSSLQLLFELLNIVAEEFETFWGEVAASQPCSSTAALLLFQTGPLVLELVEHVLCCDCTGDLQTSTGNGPSGVKDIQLIALRCLSTWVASPVVVPMQLVRESPTMAQAASLLASRQQVLSEENNSSALSVAISLLDLTHHRSVCQFCVSRTGLGPRSQHTKQCVLHRISELCRESWTTSPDTSERICTILCDVLRVLSLHPSANIERDWLLSSPILDAIASVGNTILPSLVSHIDTLASGLNNHSHSMSNETLVLVSAWRAGNQLVADIGCRIYPLIRRFFGWCSDTQANQLNQLAQTVIWIQLKGITCFWDESIVESSLEFWDTIGLFYSSIGVTHSNHSQRNNSQECILLNQIFIGSVFENFLEALLMCVTIRTCNVSASAPVPPNKLHGHYAEFEPVLFHRVRSAAFDTLTNIATHWPHNQDDFVNSFFKQNSRGQNAVTVLQYLSVQLITHDPGDWCRYDAILFLYAALAQAAQTCLSDNESQQEEECYDGSSADSESNLVPLKDTGAVSQSQSSELQNSSVALAISQASWRTAEWAHQVRQVSPGESLDDEGSTGDQQGDKLQCIQNSKCVASILYIVVVHLAETILTQIPFLRVGVCRLIAELTQWMVPRAGETGPLQSDPIVRYFPGNLRLVAGDIACPKHLAPGWGGKVPVFLMPQSLAMLETSIEYLVRCLLEPNTLLAVESARTLQNLVESVYQDSVAWAIREIPIGLLQVNQAFKDSDAVLCSGPSGTLSAVVQHCKQYMSSSTHAMQAASRVYGRLLRCRARMMVVDSCAYATQQSTQRSNTDKNNNIEVIARSAIHELQLDIQPTLTLLSQSSDPKIVCVLIEQVGSIVLGFNRLPSKVLRRSQIIVKPVLMMMWEAIHSHIVLSLNVRLAQQVAAAATELPPPVVQLFQLCESVAKCYQGIFTTIWTRDCLLEREVAEFMVNSFVCFRAPLFLDHLTSCLVHTTHPSVRRVNRHLRRNGVFTDRLGDLVASVTSVTLWGTCIASSSNTSGALQHIPLVSHSPLAETGVAKALFKFTRQALGSQKQAFLTQCNGISLLELHLYISSMSIVENLAGGGDCYRYAILLLCDLVSGGGNSRGGAGTSDKYVRLLRGCIPTLVCFVIVALSELRRTGLVKRVVDILYNLLNTVKDVVQDSTSVFTSIFVSNTIPSEQHPGCTLVVHPTLIAVCQQSIERMSVRFRKLVCDHLLAAAQQRKQRFASIISDLQLVLKGTMAEVSMTQKLLQGS